MASAQHYAWAAGHVVLLAASIRYIVAWITFKSTYYQRWYTFAYTGALVSYAIVCAKSLGTPQPNSTFLKRLLSDENSQYFLLAMYWWYSKAVPISLLPFTVFSLFHTLTFVRTTVIPQFTHQGPAAQGQAPAASPIAKKIQTWVKGNYDPAMKVVAYIELVILVRVLLGVVTFQNSILTLIVYAHFIRQRYYQSAFTREAIVWLHGQVDVNVRRPGVPPVAIQVWEMFKKVLMSWAGSAIIEPQPRPAAQGSNSNARRQSTAR